MKKPLSTGYIDKKFFIIRDILDDLLHSGEEEGCSIALQIEGRKVIDIWGGWADRDLKIPWQHDSIVSTFSVSKALVSTLGHILVDNKTIDLNKPVAKYWKNFGKFNKDQILVRNLFDHTCAITYVDKKLNYGDLYNWDLMISAIEKTKPNWEPCINPVYLNMTYGYLIGGLIEKVTGKKLSTFNRENISNKLNIDYNFSLRPKEMARVAQVYKKISRQDFLEERMQDPNSIFSKSMQGFSKDEDFNSIGWRTGEVGSGQGHGNARSISNLFEILRNNGSYNGYQVISKETRDQAIEFQCESDGNDPIIGSPIKLSLGYELNCPVFYMGPNPNAFGHWGAGGSFGFADLDSSLSFGYTPNLMHDKMELGPRGKKIVEAIYKVL